MRIIAKIFFSFILIFSIHHGAQADENDVKAAQNVIENQIQAFIADDKIRAYSFASPRIQSFFPNPDIFIEMVQRGYAPIHRPGNYAFKSHQQDGDTIKQKLSVQARDGRLYEAEYTLSKQKDGSWKISAVQLEESNDLTS